LTESKDKTQNMMNVTSAADDELSAAISPWAVQLS